MSSGWWLRGITRQMVLFTRWRFFCQRTLIHLALRTTYVSVETREIHSQGIRLVVSRHVITPQPKGCVNGSNLGTRVRVCPFGRSLWRLRSNNALSSAHDILAGRQESCLMPPQLRIIMWGPIVAPYLKVGVQHTVQNSSYRAEWLVGVLVIVILLFLCEVTQYEHSSIDHRSVVCPHCTVEYCLPHCLNLTFTFPS